MSVESKIIEISSEHIKALVPRAAKAMKTPDTGVKILNKGAYFVIRDCATIATKYLPIFLYGKLKNPVTVLKGGFTKKEISALVKRGDKETESKQLTNLMVMDAMNIQPPAKEQEKVEVEIPADPPLDDVYGDYGDFAETVEPEETESFTLDNEDDTIKYLCEVFRAI